MYWRNAASADTDVFGSTTPRTAIAGIPSIAVFKNLRDGGAGMVANEGKMTNKPGLEFRVMLLPLRYFGGTVALIDM